MKTFLRSFIAIVFVFVIALQPQAQEVITDGEGVREVKSSKWELVNKVWRSDFQAIDQAYKEKRKVGPAEKYDRYVMVMNWDKHALLTGQNHTARIANMEKYALNTNWEKLIVPSYPIFGEMYFGHAQKGYPKTGYVYGYTVKDDAVIVQNEPIARGLWRRTINGVTECVTREFYWVIRHRVCQNPFNAIAVCDGAVQREFQSTKITEILGPSNTTTNTTNNTLSVVAVSQCRPQKTPMTASSPTKGVTQAGQMENRVYTKTAFVVVNKAQSSQTPSTQCFGTAPLIGGGPVIKPPPVPTGPNNQEHDPRVPGGGPWVF